jgi:hypothetical protein
MDNTGCKKGFYREPATGAKACCRLSKECHLESNFHFAYGKESMKRNQDEATLQK